jgi:hypothetical protein
MKVLFLFRASLPKGEAIQDTKHGTPGVLRRARQHPAEAKKQPSFWSCKTIEIHLYPLAFAEPDAAHAHFDFASTRARPRAPLSAVPRRSREPSVHHATALTWVGTPLGPLL